MTDKPIAVKRSFNHLNADDPKKFAASLVRREHKGTHIEKWYRSTFAKWVANNDAYAIKLVDQRTCDSSIFVMRQALLKHLSVQDPLGAWEPIQIETLAEEWQLKALEDNRLYRWEKPDQDEADTFAHWQEFMATLPDRQIKHTVESMRDAVYNHDCMLLRQQITGTKDGFEVMPFVFSDPALYLVRLESKGSFARESELMDHCVGRSSSYFNKRKKYPIYSLRTLAADSKTSTLRTDRAPKIVDETLTPLLTFELDLANRVTIQVRGYKDRGVQQGILTILNEWFTANGYKLKSNRDDDDYDYDEDEEDEDDEDDFDGPEEELDEDEIDDD